VESGCLSGDVDNNSVMNKVWIWIVVRFVSCELGTSFMLGMRKDSGNRERRG
jgi:hypothetical protein